mmetsp:Transcript_7829/g.19361  ORF Transcript_7829/g.19361 Transcript_7829/m.19361 type:complete len:238 (-) Transcript_7829:808-1521(-)
MCSCCNRSCSCSTPCCRSCSPCTTCCCCNRIKVLPAKPGVGAVRSGTPGWRGFSMCAPKQMARCTPAAITHKMTAPTVKYRTTLPGSRSGGVAPSGKSPSGVRAVARGRGGAVKEPLPHVEVSLHSSVRCSSGVLSLRRTGASISDDCRRQGASTAADVASSSHNVANRVASETHTGSSVSNTSPKLVLRPAVAGGSSCNTSPLCVCTQMVWGKCSPHSCGAGARTYAKTASSAAPL